MKGVLSAYYLDLEEDVEEEDNLASIRMNLIGEIILYRQSMCIRQIIGIEKKGYCAN